MTVGRKKWLYCLACNDFRWANIIIGFTAKCRHCDNEFNIIESKKVSKKIKREKREEKHGKAVSKPVFGRDPQYVAFIKSRKCCVPNCLSKTVSDAHHAIHKSQGGHDRQTVPLCRSHHMQYHDQLGNASNAKAAWGVDLINLIDFYNELYRTNDLRQTVRSQFRQKEPDH